MCCLFIVIKNIHEIRQKISVHERHETAQPGLKEDIAQHLLNNQILWWKFKEALIKSTLWFDTFPVRPDNQRLGCCCLAAKSNG